MLDRVPLGKTGMSISRVGFGAWATGGGGWRFGWGGQDDRDSIAAIRRAVDLGVNWIDTAPIYGHGHSEEVVAAALDGLAYGDRPFVFTKCGLVSENGNPHAPSRRTGDADAILSDVEGSLQRLKVERLDLLQMHWPPADGVPIEDYWSVMASLRSEGKVRAIGLCNHDVMQLERAESVTHIETLQMPFSAIRREIAATGLPWCEAHDVGVLVYSPMQSGLLSGGFSRERAQALSADDWRASSPLFTGKALDANLAVAAALSAVAREHGCTAGAVAIAWVLDWKGITGAIVGGRSAAQVDGWIDAARLSLSKADRAMIAQAIADSGAGGGPIDSKQLRSRA